MSLSFLSVQGVRNLQSSSLDFDPRYNFFIGANGSGKTSLLESIYLLGTARSFRTHHYHKVVKYDQECLRVFGRVKEKAMDVQMGVQKEKDGGTQIKINQEPCYHTAYLAQHLPLQLYYSDSFKIIDSTPKIRREILDWGVFHVKQDYFKIWAQYQRILKQRNAYLREKQSYKKEGILPWDKSLSDCATLVHQLRKEYFEQLLPVLQKIIGNFFQGELTVTYEKGWGGRDNEGEPLLYHLEKDKERDFRMGYTHHGPHRADVLFQQNERFIKDVFSRGQQKLIIIAIKLAQGVFLSTITNKECVYLLDDIGAEFDENALNLVMEYLSDIPGQFFFTAVNKKHFSRLSWVKTGKMFHVKQGAVRD